VAVASRLIPLVMPPRFPMSQSYPQSSYSQPIVKSIKQRWRLGLQRSDCKDVVTIYGCASWAPLSQFGVATHDLADLAWSPDGSCLAVWDSPAYSYTGRAQGRVRGAGRNGLLGRRPGPLLLRGYCPRADVQGG
jgi:hypothetical protein